MSIVLQNKIHLYIYKYIVRYIKKYVGQGQLILYLNDPPACSSYRYSDCGQANFLLNTLHDPPVKVDIVINRTRKSDGKLSILLTFNV